MSKSNDSTRAGNSGNPRGFAVASGSTQSSADRLTQQEQIAENFYRNGELTVDPGDAVYANIRSLRAYQISDSIENLTDFDILPEVARGGDTIALTVIPRSYDTDELVSQYGQDSFRMRLEEQSLMDVIQELRSSSLSKLFNKYR